MLSLRQILSNKITLTLLDQIIVSFSNFLISILLVRFYGIEVFGKFALAFLFIHFFSSIQHSLIISPMMTIGAKIKRSNIKNNYFEGLILKQLLYGFFSSTIVFLILFNADIFFPDYNLKVFLLNLPLALFFIQFHEFIRKLFYTENKLQDVLKLDLIYHFVRFLLIILLYNFLSIGFDKVFFIYLFTSLLSSFLFLKKIIKFKISYESLIISHKRDFDFSKWLVSSTIFRWLSGNYLTLSASAFFGPHTLGLLKMAETVIGSLNILIQAFENIIAPNASRLFKKHSSVYIFYILRNSLFGLLLSITFISSVLLYPDFYIYMFYGQTNIDINNLLVLYSICYVIIILCLPFRIGLTVIEITKPIFIAFGITSLIALFISNILFNTFHIQGVVIGMILLQFVTLTILAFYFIKNTYFKT